MPSEVIKTPVRFICASTGDLQDVIADAESEPLFGCKNLTTEQCQYVVRCINEHEALQTQLTDLSKKLEVAREALADFVDDDHCQFDHHGFCQTHGGGTEEDRRCRNTAAQSAITEIDKALADTGEK